MKWIVINKYDTINLDYKNINYLLYIGGNNGEYNRQKHDFE